MENTSVLISFLIIVGVCAGAFSGFLGIGGGLIMVPALAYLLKDQQFAQGVSLSVMLPPITIMACLSYWKLHPLPEKPMGLPLEHWLIIIFVCLGFFLGSYFGGKIATTIEKSTLKQCFSVFLIIFAIYMFFDKH
ncbi:MAG: sulfite exporter TauE/SafE family protein [Candidatus Cloacimonetes bacterium]|nr:sulfite exporter TauE/SafE family protein [Candidatus Cloacimonadota bacterium]